MSLPPRSFSDLIKHLDTILEIMPLPVYIKSRDHRYIVCNSLFSALLLDMQKELIINKTLYDFPDIIPFEQAQIITRNDDAVFQSQTHLSYITDVICADGLRHFFQFNCCVIYADDENVTGVIGIMADLTEQYKLQHKNNLLTKKLSDIYRHHSLGTLAEKIVQIFCSKLSSVHNHAAMLMTARNNTDQDKLVISKIIEVNKSASRIAEKIMLFSHQGPQSVEPTDLNEIIKKLCSKNRNGIFAEHNIRLINQNKLYLINGESQLIEKALEAVIQNAVEAINHTGNITIKTSNITCDEEFQEQHPEAEFLKYACIEIINTGKPLPVEMQHLAFDPFISTKGCERGFGLSIAKSIISSHSGFMKLSATDSSTSVHIYLPKAQNYISEKPLILIVDDEILLLEMVADMAIDLGCDVIKASSGKAAVTLYESHSPPIDLVILDIMMPIMDGRTVFSEIKKFDPDSQILLSTASLDDHGIDELIKMGAIDILKKPYSFNELKIKLHKYLKDMLP